MNAAAAELRFRRVVLALDSSRDDVETLDLIAALAARLGADLSGLYVEDVDVLRLTALPGARVVSTVSRGGDAMDRAAVERTLRNRMALLQQAVEEAARRRHVASTFEVRQGRVVHEAVGAGEEQDLVVINVGRGQAPGGLVQRTGGLARELAGSRAPAVLLLRRRARVDGPVMTVYDGSDAAARALAAAIQVATVASLPSGAARPLEVVLITNRLDALEAWRSRIDDTLTARDLRPRFLHLWDGELATLARAACRDHATILVAAATMPLLAGDGLQTLLDRTESSLLLVK